MYDSDMVEAGFFSIRKTIPWKGWVVRQVGQTDAICCCVFVQTKHLPSEIQATCPTPYVAPEFNLAWYLEIPDGGSSGL